MKKIIYWFLCRVGHHGPSSIGWNEVECCYVIECDYCDRKDVLR